MVLEGETVQDEGDPLPQEREAFAEAGGDDEQGVLLLLQMLTLPMDCLEAVRYAVYSFPELTGAEEV
jgi:hypothetical protein